VEDIEAFVAIIETGSQTGGVLYPVSAFPMSAEDWSSILDRGGRGSPRQNGATIRTIC
jgi:hypothetical protein